MECQFPERLLQDSHLDRNQNVHDVKHLFPIVATNGIDYSTKKGFGMHNYGNHKAYLAVSFALSPGWSLTPTSLLSAPHSLPIKTESRTRLYWTNVSPWF